MGWRFPALCSRLGPPAPSQRLASLWASSDTLTQKQAGGQKDPFDFVHRPGLGSALGRGPGEDCLPGCGGEGSQLLPSDPRGCKKSSGQSGGRGQRSSRVGGTEATTGEEVCLFCQDHTLRPQVGGLQSPTRRRGGTVAAGRYLRLGIRAKDQPYCRKLDWGFHCLSPSPPLGRLLPTVLPARAAVLQVLGAQRA